MSEENQLFYRSTTQTLMGVCHDKLLI